MGRTPKYEVAMAFCARGCHPMMLLHDGRQTTFEATVSTPSEAITAIEHWRWQTDMSREDAIKLGIVASRQVAEFNDRLRRQGTRLFIVVTGGRPLFIREAV